MKISDLVCDELETESDISVEKITNRSVKNLDVKELSPANTLASYIWYVKSPRH